MEEFKYPMWFKDKNSNLVVKFDGLTSGIVVVPVLNCSKGEYMDTWDSHDDGEWVEVTDQYKYKEKSDKFITDMLNEKKSFSVQEKTSNKYKRKVPSTEIDVYDILKAFNVTNQATAHAIKKLLCAGDRGYKDKVQDLKEAYASISRAIELEENNDSYTMV